ncbi:MAG: hypothetical protein Ta2A_12630 [Treponemataceae bacterium]|nr:MAG: hypothetical protein Ta2A_12630 [Treponemataceae bacterium]
MVKMNPSEQKTFTVVERIYSHLIKVRNEKKTTSYSDCFSQAFGMPYTNSFCHFVTQRSVVNNIPGILGAIGRACNELKLPPLCCLVVVKSSGLCGEGVVTSQDIPVGRRSEFAKKTDLPNVYNCQNYPQQGTQQGNDFLNLVMKRLKEKHPICE